MGLGARAQERDERTEFHEPDPLREEFRSLLELLSMKYGESVSHLDTAADSELHARMFQR